MTLQNISFALPKPWTGQTFSIQSLGTLSFLVGPNGSGKSRFALTLMRTIENARLLGTDRLDGIAPSSATRAYGDHFAAGFQKGQFQNFRNAGAAGSGIDSFMILEERPDIRIIVEATISSLFNREITLEWDSGNLIPKARLSRTGDMYRADREECHGIQELIVLLTHLHNDQHRFLIIDEPELNLHPQFQSFFVQEVRKVLGSPSNQKSVLMITHSPFILDLRTMHDMESIFCFSANHTPPTFLATLHASARSQLSMLIPRLNVHHKQLFFADNPIFVEGISDAQLIEAIQERRKVSITAAGSCLIDVGGCEEVTKYLNLCGHYGKDAYFLFDLDSLFVGSLRQCLRDDGTIAEFLANLGLGPDFGGYCGQLDQALTKAVRAIESVESPQGIPEALKAYFIKLQDNDKKLARQRVAVLLEISANRASMSDILPAQLISDIEGRLRQIQEALRQKRVILLGGGALEHYLPEYQGDRYSLSDSAKKNAIAKEIVILSSATVDDSLETRYGELFRCIELLPAKPPVDTDKVLRRYVSDYIHELQTLVVSKPDWDEQQINAHFESSKQGLARIITLLVVREEP